MTLAFASRNENWLFGFPAWLQTRQPEIRTSPAHQPALRQPASRQQRRISHLGGRPAKQLSSAQSNQPFNYITSRQPARQSANMPSNQSSQPASQPASQQVTSEFSQPSQSASWPTSQPFQAASHPQPASQRPASQPVGRESKQPAPTSKTAFGA